MNTMKRVAAYFLPLALAGGLHAQDRTKALKELNDRIEQLQKDTDEAFEEFENRFLKTDQELGRLRPGTTGFLFSGFSSFTYTDRAGSPSSFDVTFNPIFLFKLNDNLFIESEVEFELSDVSSAGEPGFETDAGLEYAHMVWAPRDEIMVGVGKFLLPFGQFGERLHPAWINKLPDSPLLYGHSGIIPMNDIGIDIRGGIRVMERGSVNYAFYLTNGPMLDTTEGTISTGDPTDNNFNKALGGRVGFLPHPSVEIGVSFMSGKSAFDTGTVSGDLDTLLLGVDVAYIRSFDAIKGTLDARFEWAQSDVDSDPAILGGVDNLRRGWYSQIAYRPDKLESLFKNFECVLRFDSVKLPSSLNEDRSRFTLGTNYWIGNSTVVKLAYQFDERDDSSQETDSFMFQVGMGF